jgi:hypothetical protein
MICFAKSVLTEDLCVVQKEKCSVTCYMCDEGPSIFITDNPIFSSESVLHKDHDCKNSIEKISGRGS